MPDKAWTIFGLRWAAFYAVLAVLNEIIWRNTSEDFWSNSKLFLSIPLAIVFMLANLPFLMKHNIEEPEEAAPCQESGRRSLTCGRPAGSSACGSQLLYVRGCQRLAADGPVAAFDFLHANPGDAAHGFVLDGNHRVGDLPIIVFF